MSRYLALVLLLLVVLAQPASAGQRTGDVREETQTGAERPEPGQAEVWVTRSGTRIVQVDVGVECYWRKPAPDEIRNQIRLGDATGIIDTDSATRTLSDGTQQILIVWDCEAITAGDLTFRWITVRTTDQIAQQARRTITLPTPQPITQPSFGLVSHPLWLHVANSWQAINATASLSGVSATARATPVRVTWRFGDYATITCDDAGVSFNDSMNPENPPCGLIPAQTTAGMTDAHGNIDRVTVTVEILWHWSWTATDGSGNANWGSESTISVIHDFGIGEVQSLNT